MTTGRLEQPQENGAKDARSGRLLLEYAAWLSLLIPVTAMALMFAIYFHLILTVNILGPVAMGAFVAAGFGLLSGIVSLCGIAKQPKKFTITIAVVDWPRTGWTRSRRSSSF